MYNKTKIVFRGHVYTTPKTESVEITNQGVLCASGGSAKSFGIGVTGRGL